MAREATSTRTYNVNARKLAATDAHMQRQDHRVGIVSCGVVVQPLRIHSRRTT